MTEREAADGLIELALRIVVDAEGRNYTNDELEALIHYLTFAAVKVKKLPGGRDAANAVYERASAELERRKARQP